MSVVDPPLANLLVGSPNYTATWEAAWSVILPQIITCPADLQKDKSGYTRAKHKIATRVASWREDGFLDQYDGTKQLRLSAPAGVVRAHQLLGLPLPSPARQPSPLAPVNNPANSSSVVPRSGGGVETPWHRETVALLKANPSLIISDLGIDPLVRAWCDSCTSADGQNLWLSLWTRKHPDNVFEQKSGKITVVEVEPDATAIDGFAQVWGDYCTALRIDRRRTGRDVQIEGVLVTESASAALRRELGILIVESGIRLEQL